MSIYTTLDKIIENSDQLFAGSLRKWRVKILRTVLSISKITNVDTFDILSGLMVDLSAVRALYPIHIYKYRGRNHQCSRVDGTLMEIHTLETNLTKPEPMWVLREHVEPIRKAKFDSLMYRAIQQYKTDVVSRVFSPKNGYKIETEEAVVVAKSGSVPTTRTIQKRKPVKTFQNVELDFIPSSASFQLPDKNACFEAKIICEDIVSKLRSVLSPNGLIILDLIIDDPDKTNAVINRNHGIPLRVVDRARAEIARKAEKLCGEFNPGILQPAYFYE